MVTLYVMSMEPFAGKTVLCLGIARKMAGEGLSVGYIRPLTQAAPQLESARSCAAVMKRSLGLMEPMDVLNPVTINAESLEAIFSGRAGNLHQKVTDAFRLASSGKDVMVAEGVSGLAEGSMVGLDAQSTAELLDAKALLVLRGKSETIGDQAMVAKKRLGERLMGVVVNAVPQSRMEFVSETLTGFLASKGIKVYAVLPEDRLLSSVSVGELVERLNGRVIVGQEHMDHLVENVMVGAMSVENALKYFRRKPNKVVITGGDRPDIQILALETSTKCLILTGNLEPSPMILGRAEELNVPVVLVSHDTLGAVNAVEQAFLEVQFYDEKKNRRFEQMLETSLDYGSLRHDLGLGPRE